MTESRDRVRVLYIAGIGRSGSTLLGDMLGQVPGFVCLGEMQRLWLKGVIENQPCACREPFDRCSLWSEVFQRGFGGIEGVDGRAIERLMQSQLRTRYFLSIYRNDRNPESSEDLTKLAGAIEALYLAARDVTDCQVIVDVSKSPIYALFLMQIPSIELRVLHLVRDPRAVAHSWRRKGSQPITGEPIMRLSIPMASALWAAWNLGSSVLARRSAGGDAYLRIRYEDFVRDPRAGFSDAVHFAGAEFDGHPFVGSRRVDLGPNHILAGNNVRYQLGPVDIESDMEWKSAMGAAQKALVTGITLPLLPAYGYPLLA